MSRSAGDLHGGAAVDVDVRHQDAGRRVVKLLERPGNRARETGILLRRDELPHVAWRRARWNAMHQSLVFLHTLKDFLQSAETWHLEMRHTPGADQRPDMGSLTGRPWAFAIKRFVALPVVTVTRERDTGVVRASPVMAGSFVAEENR